MMKFIISVFVVVSATPLLAGGGYYWRFYTGDIPKDAFEGGNDASKQPIYIGMTLHPGSTLRPGTIYPYKRSMFYGYGSKEHKAVLEVYILCAEYKKQFEWIKTGINKTIAEVTGNNKLQIIQAGSDVVKNVLYVGRAVIRDNQALIGPVLTVNGILNLIWVADHGEEWFLPNYEILVYNPTITFKENRGGNNITINIYN